MENQSKPLLSKPTKLIFAGGAVVALGSLYKMRNSVLLDNGDTPYDAWIDRAKYELCDKPFPKDTPWTVRVEGEKAKRLNQAEI